MIKINNNEFNNRDEVTLFYNDEIIQGEIYIENDEEYYILHNNRNYWYDDTPIKSAYKYACYFYEHDKVNLFHRFDIEKAFDPFETINPGIRCFILDKTNLYPLFWSNLDEINKYDSITESTQQGFVELHSKKRKKKLDIKLGRLTRKLVIQFNEKLKTNPKNNLIQFLDKDIEKLHNEWMAAHASEVKYDIISGDDILIGYSRENYCSKEGTLHNSCMTDKKSLLNLYTKNPDKISLIIFYDSIETNKIAGRTLLWKCDDGNTYFDRIYYSQDWFEHAYENVCKNLGFLVSHETNKELKVTLKNLDFRKYPYVDTFNKISFKQKALFHNAPEEMKLRYVLKNTSGHIQEI